MTDMRYTKRHARAAFERLAEATGATIADSSWAIDDPRREGAWMLDHNSTYGGYVVTAYVKSTKVPGHRQTFTAETCPLGHERHSAREFVSHVNYALRVLDVAR